MAKRPNKSEEKSTWQNGFGNADFADVTLTQSDKDAFLKWMTGAAADFSEALTMCLQEGYRLSLKFDYDNSCYIASLTQQDRKHHNHNLVITSRSDDAEEAFFLSFYKVAILFPGERLPTRAETRRDWG
jgi:hypothetical protein